MLQFSEMKRRALRIVVFFWLGWYISGPLCATFDFWDPPSEEARDVQRNAGGAVTLVAAIFCFAVCSIRKLCQRCSFQARALWGWLPPLSFCFPTPVTTAKPPSSHSPPLSPLRI
jgi:hypothetical protein